MTRRFKKALNIFEMNIQAGQSFSGLIESSQYLRNYLSDLEKLGFVFTHRGGVTSPYAGQKVNSNEDLEMIDFLPYQEAYKEIKNLLKEPRTLLNWGGDHSVALSTVGAFNSEFPDGFVLWIDAHADLNLPIESQSGNLHGMPVSFLLNLGGCHETYLPWLKTHLKPKNIFYLGLRDLDPFEKSMIDLYCIQSASMEQIRVYGIKTVMRYIIAQIQGRPLHVSFDIDSVDPKFAPSTGVPVAGGFHFNDLRIIGSYLAQEQNLRSVDIVEVNPLLGSPQQVRQTYVTALEFLKSICNFYPGVKDESTCRTNETKFEIAMEPTSLF